MQLRIFAFYSIVSANAVVFNTEQSVALHSPLDNQPLSNETSETGRLGRRHLVSRRYANQTAVFNSVIQSILAKYRHHDGPAKDKTQEGDSESPKADQDTESQLPKHPESDPPEAASAELSTEIADDFDESAEDVDEIAEDVDKEQVL